jgi:hypothetical protein
MQIRILALFGLCWVMLAPIAARADDQGDKNACMTDAQVYCGEFIPDRERVAHCLMDNRRRISLACREALKHFK